MTKAFRRNALRGVDEIVGPDDMDSENFPSEKSMERWHHWFIFNMMNMEGHIRTYKIERSSNLGI